MNKDLKLRQTYLFLSVSVFVKGYKTKKMPSFRLLIDTSYNGWYCKHCHFCTRPFRVSYFDHFFQIFQKRYPTKKYMHEEGAIAFIAPWLHKAYIPILEDNLKETITLIYCSKGSLSLKFIHQKRLQDSFVALFARYNLSKGIFYNNS